MCDLEYACLYAQKERQTSRQMHGCRVYTVTVDELRQYADTYCIVCSRQIRRLRRNVLRWAQETAGVCNPRKS